MSWLAGIALALLLLLLALQSVPRVRARRSLGRSVTGVPGPVGQLIDAGAEVLVVFSSPSCAACRAQEPAVESLRREFPSVHTVNVAEHPAVARALGVMATPSAVFVRGGSVRAFLVGVQTEKRLRALLHSSPSA